MKGLDQLAGFNLTKCGQGLDKLHLVPALGLKWVRLGARPTPLPAEWTPLDNKKLTRALLESTLGDDAVLDLTLAQFERFGLMGVVSNRSYIEVSPPPLPGSPPPRPAPRSAPLAHRVPCVGISGHALASLFR